MKLASFTEKMFQGLDNVKAGWFQQEFKSLASCLEILSVGQNVDDTSISTKTRQVQKPPSVVERALRETNVYIKTCTDQSISPSYVRIKHTIIQNYGDDVFAKIKADVRASCAAAATVPAPHRVKEKQSHFVKEKQNHFVKEKQNHFIRRSNRSSTTTTTTTRTTTTKRTVTAPKMNNIKSVSSTDLCSTMSSEEEDEEEDNESDESGVLI